MVLLSQSEFIVVLPAAGAALHRHLASCIRTKLLEAATALTAAEKKPLINSLVEDLYSSMDIPEAVWTYPKRYT